MIARDAVMSRLRCGILPTVSEQQTLGMSQTDLAKEWTAGMRRAAETQRQEFEAELCSAVGNRCYAYFNEWSREPGHASDARLVHECIEMVLQHAGEIITALVQEHLDQAFRNKAPSAAEYMSRRPDPLFRGSTPPAWEPFGSIFSPGACPFSAFIPLALGGRRLVPHAASLITMRTAHGGRSGMCVKWNGSAVLVIITALLGECDFDPSDNTLNAGDEFTQRQVLMSFERGLPCVADLLNALLRYPAQPHKLSRDYKGPGYRRDGKATVPFWTIQH